MSKKPKTTRPRRERKGEKPAKRPVKPRRAAVKVPPPPRKAVEKVVEKEPEPLERYLIAVRLDGMPGVKPPEELTLNALRMRTRFSAVLLQDTPSIRGMLQKVKDHVTWAEATKKDLELLLSNRAATQEGLGITDEFVKERAKLPGLAGLLSALYSGKITLSKLWQIGVKPVFRLHPPRGGFPNSTKRPFADRGELGYRREGLHSLLIKMR